MTSFQQNGPLNSEMDIASLTALTEILENRYLEYGKEPENSEMDFSSLLSSGEVRPFRSHNLDRYDYQSFTKGRNASETFRTAHKSFRH